MKNEKFKKGEIIVIVQGNGVLGVGYFFYSNKNDINKKIDFVLNNGYIFGEVNLIGGNVEVFGLIEEVYFVVNGIFGLVLFDFGEGGIVDGLGGVIRSGRRKLVSLFFINILVFKIVEKNLENKVGEIKKMDLKDFYGKNNKFILGDIINSEIILGKVILKIKEGYIRKDFEVFGGKLVILY